MILLKALVRDQKSILVLTGVQRLLNTCIQAFPSILVARLLRSIEAGNAQPISQSLKAAALLVSVLSIKMITENLFFHNVVNMSTQVRGALEGLIFDKSLRLPEGGSGVLNLMQSDAATIEGAAMQLHTFWDGPLQISIYTYLLFQYIGPSVAWGLAVLLTVIPLNSITLRILDRLSQKENEAKTARTKRTNESITQMKLLKVQGWEKTFANDVDAHRREELNIHRMRGVVRAFNSAFSNAVPSLVLVVTLTAYAKTGNPIKASTIFTAISLFNQLRFPLFFYPMLLDSLASAKISMRKIASYLTSEEITPYVQILSPKDDGGGQIEMKDGSFLWSTSNQIEDGEVAPPNSPALCGVNLKVNPGEVVAVVGSVASGKSALIKSLLGELTPVPRIVVDNKNGAATNSSQTDELMNRPQVTVHGNIGYCSQEAWIPKGTLKEAIVFGREYDETRYQQAIFDAGLDQDLADGTLFSEIDVGEKGGSLSGGQRARVALARALYGDENTKVFLLDDCLAALDARVGSLVFERVTKRAKASKAALILVTNDPSLPRLCDRVILMGPESSCSTIIDTGTYDQLLSRGHKLQRNIDDDTKEHDEDASRILDQTEIKQNYNQTDTIRVVGDTETNSNSTTSTVSHSKSPSRANGLLSIDDGMNTQAVPISTYVGYLKAVASPSLIIGALASFLVADGAKFFQQYTVAKWTELAADSSSSIAAAMGSKYLSNIVYAAGVLSVFLWLRSFLTMHVGLRASTFYHNRMLSSVFRAPMSFFDSTPSGQILSRFGKELETVDRALPESIASVLFCFLQIMSSVLALSGAISPAMMIPITFAGGMYLRIMKRFRPAARDMKRNEQRTRSPIFTHFGEALRGTEIIRSIPGAKRTWSGRHRKLADVNLSVFSTVKALDRWLSINLEAIGNTMVFVTSLSCVFLTRSGKLQSGAAAWGLTQSLAITGLMAWAVRNLTMLESHMMSVTRVSELTDIDTENGKNALVADGWPWRGGIEFKKISMRYNPSSPLVLNQVTLSVPPGSTLGVVGRTGSGKSSLLLSLFRIVEIESGGSIEIDGVDVRSVSMESLRDSIAIIPQDPTLFAGTLAFNLDAKGKATPEDMWKALEAASPDLVRQFKALGGLETEISEDGGNLSQGQRQLICLARAMLKNSKILVLDEATSSVDAQTDQQVQNTIRKQFVEKGVSVITVAHRLDTVLGCDKIAVLGQGELIEYDSPSNLLKIRNGEFRSLVDADRANKMRGSKQRTSSKQTTRV
ncbi:P-loop containing nucleoside triphosphate hydrolase protein [Fragilariopsis cylindrus CCMP1102]|uniref:p-loop containing nucleoside triphosphate hydrolase protein n=1 Tax=Fragilariopsis cylindrus CCMP1102 TaxID=635003 RepID=A0A1E7EXP3_9STRA|nr:P-loop containing nucleoside triphosphate hydrolase protein [Fragilariopsis cylindrus CCMP1102]|eukprot:OEU10585.1 P-loop containing nucleoside triphosphate hydrolase protein [Fragilariopsis cylindrus CCMP1102]